jgi:hypothetical protein
MRCDGMLDEGEHIWRETDKGRERVQVCGSLCFEGLCDRSATIQKTPSWNIPLRIMKYHLSYL